jgi:hypothetical protein
LLGGRVFPGAAFAISVVCLVAQLLAVAHEATERHVICAEHGELSHLRPSAGPLSLEGGRTRSRAVADAALTESAVHEHCAFLLSARGVRGKPILLVASAPEPALPPTPRAAPIVAAPAERILLSAPKIAPPAAPAPPARTNAAFFC